MEFFELAYYILTLSLKHKDEVGFFFGLVQTIILGLTAWLAYKIGTRQNEINERMIHREICPSISLGYTGNDFEVRNTGNVLFYVTEFIVSANYAGSQNEIFKKNFGKARINPQGAVGLTPDVALRLKEALDKCRGGGVINFLSQLFVQDMLGNKYVSMHEVMFFENHIRTNDGDLKRL